MRWPLHKSLAFIFIFATACAIITPAAAAPVSETIDRFNQLIARAQAESDFDQAWALLDEADRMLVGAPITLGGERRRFLSADLGRARGQLLALSLEKKDDPEKRQQAIQHLNLAINDYNYLLTILLKRAAVAAQRTTSSQRMQDPDYRKAVGLQSQAIYSLGWCHYYLALCQSTELEIKKSLAQSISNFEHFTTHGYEKNAAVVDCFVGQALAYLQLDRPHKAIEILHPANSDNTTLNSYRRLTSVRMKAFFKTDSWHRAFQAASQYYAARDADGSGQADATTDHAIEIERIIALAKLSNPQINPGHHATFTPLYIKARTEFYTLGQPWKSRLLFRLGEMLDTGGYTQLLDANDQFELAEYEQASETARLGLMQAEGGDDTVLSGELLHIIAAASANTLDWKRAFVASLKFIDLYPRDERAGPIFKVAMFAATQLKREDVDIPVTLLLQFYDIANLHFADYPEAARVPWYRGHLLLEIGRFAEAQQYLQTLQPSSPVYLEAQYGITLAAMAQHKYSLLTIPSVHIDNAARAIDLFTTHLPDPVPPRYKPLASAVRDLGLETARAWMFCDPPQPDKALAVLNQCRTLAQSTAVTDPRETALRMHIAVLQSDPDQAISILCQTLDNQAVTAPFAASLSALADHLEQQLADLQQQADESLVTQMQVILRDVYQALLQYQHEQIANPDPARQIILHRRLAQKLFDLGQIDEAFEHYTWLISRVPVDEAADVVKGLAYGYENRNEFDLAADRWKQLTLGLDKTTQPWIEASVHLIDCYIQLERFQQADIHLKNLLLQASDLDQSPYAEQLPDYQQQITRGLARQLPEQSDPATDTPTPTPQGNE